MCANLTEAYRDPAVAQRYDRRFSGRGRLSDWLVHRSVLRLLRRAGSGQLPQSVVDVPAGTGRFTKVLRRQGIAMIHLDSSAEMLAVLRTKNGPGQEIVCDLHARPLAFQSMGVILCFRLMQHLNSDERQKTLQSLAKIAPWAIVAYYPGWHPKTWSRRYKRRLGLRTKKIREFISLQNIRREVSASGWNLESWHPVAPLLSENVLLLLSKK